MMTPDKDYGQLVDDHIFLYKPGRQGNEVEILGPKEVCERWGIKRVDQVVDMLGDGISTRSPAVTGSESGSCTCLEHFAHLRAFREGRL